MSLEDRFEIESPIHIGQVSTAYPAKIIGEDRKVLLKVIHPQWAQDKELVERFAREGKTIASIDHPNVVKVLEFGKIDHVPFMALEWVDGGTLADRLVNGPLMQIDLNRIAEEILTGLQAVHDAGMVHRDLKPDNILIGTDGHVRLADFSLAGFSGRSKMTEHGAIIGSPAYMAPELLDASPATPASDLYSVGIILLEALTGSNPYQSSDPMVSLSLVRTVSPPTLSGRKNINTDLARLVDALLTRPVGNRPQTAEDALDILNDKGPRSHSHELPDREPTEPRAYRGIRVSVLYYFLFAVIGLLLVSIPWLMNRNSIENGVDIPEIDQTGVSAGLTEPVVEIAEVDFASDELLIDTVSRSEGRSDDTGLVFNEQPKLRIANPDPGIIKIIEKGFVALVVRPWARVFIDGEDIGVTPFGRIELPSGKHNFIFVNPSFPSYTQPLEVESGVTDTLKVDLTAVFGRVEVSALPWGYLWVDGDSVGILPRADPIWLVSGKHEFLVRHPSLSDWRDSVTVNAGESYNFRIDLKSGTMIAQ